ncbi:hypothetical protein vseg_020510 [Gypsophila vaccaria]
MPKTRRTTNLNGGRIQGEDRLGSLPDEILIQILSCLPLQLAIVTECLSTRWRGLWTYITSINIDDSASRYKQEFLDALDDDIIRSKIISPFIHTFSFEKLQGFECLPNLDSWLRHLCDRNIRELRLTWRYRCDCRHEFPMNMFRKQSLVSIELGPAFHWTMPDDDCEPVNLPNLKSLSLFLCPSISEWVVKQIKLCPSLEQLSLKCGKDGLNLAGQRRILTCSNQNLRRLSVHFGCFTVNLMLLINAPKLEYLAIRAPKSSSFYFANNGPVLLREAKIETTCADALSYWRKKLMLKFYEDISNNVRFLGLDINSLDSVSCTVFHRTTCLSLDMGISKNISIVLSLLELFPVLDVLTLKFDYIGTRLNRVLSPLPDLPKVRKTRRELERIEIQSFWTGSYVDVALPVLGLIEYLLSNTLGLEHFRVDIAAGRPRENVIVNHNQSVELDLCRLLYRCPMVSEGCEVEFVGRCFTMSRKVGPIVKTVDGEVIQLFTS